MGTERPSVGFYALEDFGSEFRKNCETTRWAVSTPDSGRALRARACLLGVGFRRPFMPEATTDKV